MNETVVARVDHDAGQSQQPQVLRGDEQSLFSKTSEETQGQRGQRAAKGDA